MNSKTPLQRHSSGPRRINPQCAALLAAVFVLLPPAAHAQAIEAWVQRFAGPGQETSLSPPAMVVDANGNVIVTGPSYGGEPLPNYCDDWVTTKYSPEGVPLWTNRKTENIHGACPSALAVDTVGNVFVSGFTSDLTTIYGTTVKYSSEGPTLWTRNSLELHQPHSLVVDCSGNVIVAGLTWDGASHHVVTIKYSSDGTQLWTRRYNDVAGWGPAAATDADGNVVVMVHASVPDSCVVTVKYSSSAGIPLWTNRYPDLDLNYFPLALDRSGNVLVTGGEQRAGTWRDFVTIKCSSAGAPLWTNLYNGPANGNDSPCAVAVDTHDNVYVAGSIDGGSPWSGGTVLDYATIKYSSAGAPLWTNLYNGPANGNDSPCAVAVDTHDNVYVAGTAETTTFPFQDYATIKYSSAGVPLWTNLYSGTGNQFDHATALAVDPAGNAFVTGVSSPDWATVAYSSSGVRLWTMFHSPSGGASGLTWPCAVAADSAGAVYVTGISRVSATGTHQSDVVTIKYVVPPIITCQPLSCTNGVGAPASFTVEAVGGLPLTYQWRKGDADLVDGGNISGVTTANLVIADVQLTDAGDYSVVVTNVYGKATSTAAQLTVVVPPSAGRLTNPTWSPATGFSFHFRDGTIGQPYRIQRSSALAEGSWVDWQSFTYREPLGLMDVGATSVEARFYRAISP